MSPAGSFTSCVPYLSSTVSSPPSYSSGSARKRVTDRSVRILIGVPGIARMAPSTCVPKCWPTP